MSIFFETLTEAKGKPGIGGLPLNFITMFDINAKDITIDFSTPSADTCRTDYFYNSRSNILYRKKKIKQFYTIWHPVAYF